jgi:flagellar motor switch protein FliM
MTKNLSREETDRIAPEAKAGDAEPHSGNAKIKLYDFKRPDKFSKEQIRTVEIIHETFARLATTTLSAHLRSLAHVHVAAVDQLTYEEFIRSIPNPTTIGVVHMDPLKGSAVLQIDPSVTFCIIDRLFGGKGEWGNFNREVTDIEMSIMESVFIRLLGNLRESWALMLDLRPRLGQVEVNPQFAQIVPPSEMIVLVTFEVGLGDSTGMMNLVLPYLTIEPIIHKLSAQYWYSSLAKSPFTPAVAPSGLDIPAEVILEGEKIALRDIGKLRKGSRIHVPGLARREAFLRMGGRTLFRLETRNGGRKKPKHYAVSGGIREESGAYLESMGKGNEPREAESALQGTIKELGATLGASIAGMKNAISALQQKQEEISDQLAMGPQAPEAEMGRAGSQMPFDLTRRTDPAHLLSFLQQEHPQCIALILSYLEPQKASFILGNLPAEMQPDVARRIVGMGRTSPEVLREVERVLEKKLSVISSEEFTAAGGVESIVEILNFADRSTERHIVDSLQQKDPEMAEEIKKRMFVFEDIVLLDRRDVEKILKKTAPELLLRALKAVEEKVKSFIWECVPKADVEKLARQFEEMGRVRLNEVEAAQQKIVGLIREMEENGGIVVAHPSEMIG